MKKNNELEFESDKVKVYVQQVQAINGLLTTENDELKAELNNLKSLKEEYYKQTLDDEIQINNLFQVLQEIKQVALQILDDDDYHCPFELTKEILNKIEKLKTEEC